MKCVSALDFERDLNSWRNILEQGIQQAKRLVVSDETIQSLATKMGDFLVEKVCPATKEEELLKEFWNVRTPEERKVLATLMFKLVQKS